MITGFCHRHDCSRIAHTMEQAHHRSLSVSRRLSFVVSENARASNTDVEAQTLGDGESLLKCFSPLFNSMRLFGLYFTQASRRIHDASTSTAVTTDSKKWNGGRIYAVVIMVVGWLNVARMFTMFDKTDKVEFILLLKVGAISAELFNAVLHTACFVACQTGNLDRVFLDARLPKSDIARYRRLAVIHMTVVWFLLTVDTVLFLVLSISAGAWSFSLTPIGVHIIVSDELLLLGKVMMFLLFVFVHFAWLFSHSVNYSIRYKVKRMYRTDCQF